MVLLVNSMEFGKSRITHPQRRRMRIKHQFRIRDASPDRQPKMESFLVREILQRIMGQTNNDCRFQIFISTNSPTPATFLLVGRKDSRLRYVLSYGIYALDQRSGDGYSVDDLKSSLSVRGLRMPDFEVLMRVLLQHWTELYIIPTSKEMSAWRIKKPKKRTVSFAEDRSLSWSTSTSGSLEPMILSRIMPTYLLLHLEMTIFRNSIRNGMEFYDQWRKSHLMTSWKDCTNKEYEGLRNSGPCWNCMTWRFIIRKQDLIITDWRHWWKEVSSKIYETRILAREMEIMRETPWSRIQGQQRVRRILGDRWEWETNGQCSNGDNCSFRHDIHKRAKLPQPNPSPSSFMRQNERNASRTRSPEARSPSGRMSRWPCKDYLNGTCTDPFCEKWHPPECLFYKTKSGCRFREKCSYAHRQVDEQPSKRSKKNDDKSAVAMLKKHELHDRTGQPVVCRDNRHVQGHGPVVCNSSNTWQLGCVFQEMVPPKLSSIFRKSSDKQKPIQRVKFTNAIARYAKIRDQSLSLGMICLGEPHQRSTNAPKFEDRSQEETEWQERWALEAALRLANSILTLKGEKPSNILLTFGE